MISSTLAWDFEGLCDFVQILWNLQEPQHPLFASGSTGATRHHAFEASITSARRDKAEIGELGEMLGINVMAWPF